MTSFGLGTRLLDLGKEKLSSFCPIQQICQGKLVKICQGKLVRLKGAFEIRQPISVLGLNIPEMFQRQKDFGHNYSMLILLIG